MSISRPGSGSAGPFGQVVVADEAERMTFRDEHDPHVSLGAVLGDQHALLDRVAYPRLEIADTVVEVDHHLLFTFDER